MYNLYNVSCDYRCMLISMLKTIFVFVPVEGIETIKIYDSVPVLYK